MDPVSLTLTASGGQRAESPEFRTLDGEDDLGTPLASLQSEGCRIDDRLAYRKRHDWRMGVRLGSNAYGT